MKLAVIGQGLSALEATLYFHRLGAHVVCFTEGKMGGILRRLLNYDAHRFMPKKWDEVTTDWGRELLELRLEDLDPHPTYENFFQLYFDPLFKIAEEKNLIKDVPVSRVHKRFLSLGEQPQEGSRLNDLFRVVWTLNPESSVRAMVEENEIFFKAMGNEAMESLKAPIESFEDFDLIIEAPEFYDNPLPMGPSSSLAVNEFNLGQEPEVYYSHEALEVLEDIKKESEKILIVGSGAIAAFYVLELEAWLKDNPKNEIQLITTEAVPFSNFLNSDEDKVTARNLLKFLVKIEEDYQSRCDSYAKELRHYRDLEDHEKVKEQVPVEPKRQWQMHKASNVTSLDQLSDREGIYVTCEQSSLHGGEDSLSTLSVQRIIVATGHEKETGLAHGLQKDEPGHYLFDDSSIVEQIKSTEKSIMTFFSRAKE